MNKKETYVLGPSHLHEDIICEDWIRVEVKC